MVRGSYQSISGGLWSGPWCPKIISVATESEFLAGGEIMSESSEIDQIVQDILADMPLKEKAIIANLDEDKV